MSKLFSFFDGNCALQPEEGSKCAVVASHCHLEKEEECSTYLVCDKRFCWVLQDTLLLN